MTFPVNLLTDTKHPAVSTNHSADISVINKNCVCQNANNFRHIDDDDEENLAVFIKMTKTKNEN